MDYIPPGGDGEGVAFSFLGTFSYIWNGIGFLGALDTLSAAERRAMVMHGNLWPMSRNTYKHRTCARTSKTAMFRNFPLIQGLKCL
jgi:hypothetical protein